MSAAFFSVECLFHKCETVTPTPRLFHVRHFLAINCHFISFGGSLTPKLVDIEVLFTEVLILKTSFVCDYFHVCVCVYLLICMCSICMQCSKGPEEGVVTPRAGICEL